MQTFGVNWSMYQSSKDVLVGWLSDKNGPPFALLSSSTELGTDVPWVMPERFRKGAKKSKGQWGGGEEGQFCQLTIIRHLSRQKEKERPENRCILLIKGSVRHFNKILVKFILFYEGGGGMGASQACRGGGYTYS